MDAGFHRRVLDIIFQNRMTDIFFSPNWKWIECGGEQTRADIVLETNIARAVQDLLVRCSLWNFLRTLTQEVHV